METKELLVRLIKKMPEGWRLSYTSLTGWSLGESGGGASSWQLWRLTKAGVVTDDLSLAPLTALLKQSLDVRDMPEAGDSMEVEGGVRWWPGGRGEGFDTEFEAVAHAYLEAR